MAAVADLPFFFVFCVLFWFIAGWLVLVPLAACVLLIVPSLLAQPRLRALAQAGMRESSLRNAMLVEAVQGIDDIKVLQAEPRFQNQWNHYNAVNADSGLQLRALLNTLSNWTQTVQGAAFAFVVFFGAPLVMDGHMSTGVLVAASILSTRMLAPLAGVTQVLNRWQQAKVAGEALDQLMKLPVDHPPHETRVHRPAVQGDYALRDAVFSHDGQTTALHVKALHIGAGERIAVLGRNGAGKSTLLQALSGLLEPRAGSVLLDGVSMAHIDPADVRRDVGLLAQDARLFHGTLRENLQMGTPHATDAELVAALQATGAWAFVRRLPTGLDHPLLEGGRGLSGGQRQSLLLARLLLRRPGVLLLDEPTASLDEVAEREVIEQLRALPAGRTLVLATHRPAVLEAVDRILVVDGGAVVLDGPREQVMARLRQGAVASREAMASAGRSKEGQA
ncbi:Toxin RTX-I translocation ATP-binding protein [compost metagenome]